MTLATLPPPGKTRLGRTVRRAAEILTAAGTDWRLAHRAFYYPEHLTSRTATEIDSLAAAYDDAWQTAIDELPGVARR